MPYKFPACYGIRKKKKMHKNFVHLFYCPLEYVSKEAAFFVFLVRKNFFKIRTFLLKTIDFLKKVMYNVIKSGEKWIKNL